MHTLTHSEVGGVIKIRSTLRLTTCVLHDKNRGLRGSDNTLLPNSERRNVLVQRTQAGQFLDARKTC